MNYTELKKFFDFTARKINPIMEELLTSYVDGKNKEAVFYQVSTGGKRLRPALAVISCKMMGGDIEDVLYPAASLEILHNYSLIIDDIADHAKLRRTKPTLWYEVGKSVAVMISIDYSASLFQGAVKSKKPVELSNLFARTMKNLVDGEILDLLFEQANRSDKPFIKENNYKEITEEDYFKMISQKAAALIQASCETGGLVAGTEEIQLKFLRKYGFDLGMAFQVKDDILDIFGKQKVFGKKKGKDIIEGKLGNIVILLSFKELLESDKKRFLEILRKREKNEKDVSEAINLIKKTNAISEAVNLGKKFIDEAKKSLAKLPQNKWNKTLEVIADFVMEREK